MELVKYPSVGCFYRLMGLPNPSVRTSSVQSDACGAKPANDEKSRVISSITRNSSVSTRVSGPGSSAVFINHNKVYSCYGWNFKDLMIFTE